MDPSPLVKTTKQSNKQKLAMMLLRIGVAAETNQGRNRRALSAELYRWNQGGASSAVLREGILSVERDAPQTDSTVEDGDMAQIDAIPRNCVFQFRTCSFR